MTVSEVEPAEPEVAPATVEARRRPGHLGPLGVGRIAGIQVVVVAVLAVARYSLWVVVPAAVAGFALITAVLVRVEGRWGTERALLVLRRSGAAAGPAGGGTDPRLAAVRELAPQLRIGTHTGGSGSPVGIARDGAGWFAAVVTLPVGGMFGDPAPPLPLDGLVRVAREIGLPGCSLQVVRHTVPWCEPAPAPAPADRSYATLVEGNEVPADEITWVAVRVDAAALAESGVTAHAAATETPKILATAARRVVRALRRAGTPAAVLDEEGLLDALSRSLGLDRSSPAPAPAQGWRSWEAAGLGHSSFWLRDWPPAGGLPDLLNGLGRVPASFTTVALTFTPGRDGTQVRCTVRVAAAPADLDGCRTGITAVAGGLRPLDGEQAAAAYATAPTGGIA